VIASDLPGLRGVIERSGGGILFTPGSAEDLAAKILLLYNDRALLNKFATIAREFALREANRETEMKKFVAVFAKVCQERLGVWLAH
jgi:glycosyltransferase involved in cell wall biosynthesis